MKSLILASFTMFAASTAAQASCVLVDDPCVTDGRGNTYVTRQTLSGSYETFRNGRPHSHTSQTLDGSYREHLRGGGSLYYDRDPFESDFD